MVVSGTLYTPAKYHKSYRGLLAAKYSKAQVKVADYIPGKTDGDAKFSAKFPPSEVPCFEGSDGTNIFDANAIAHFLGNEQLRGGKQEHMVTQWANYTDTVILPSVASWVYPCLGVGQFNKHSTDQAKENLTKVMKFMNEHLSKVTYLVGEAVTQADLTVFTAFQLLMTNVYDENSRKPFPHVVRWFNTIANQPDVIAVCGTTTLCVKPAVADCKKPASGGGKQQSAAAKGDAGKKKEAKPAEKKAEKPAAEEPPKKKEDKLAALPAGKLNLEEWKREFSNNDLDKVALPWLLEHFEPEFYSIWYCEYKYPEELNMIFQSNNLIGGMFQRCEGMIKYGFAGQHVFGKSKDSQISGVWLWRGTGLIFELSEDLQTDYESYTWKKLDPKNPTDLKVIRDHWKGEGHYHGRDYADGKIFK